MNNVRKYIACILIILAAVSCSQDKKKKTAGADGKDSNGSVLFSGDTVEKPEIDTLSRDLIGNIPVLPGGVLTTGTAADFSILTKKIADPESIKSIDFSDCKLKKLPDAVPELKNLVSIDLSGNPQMDLADAFKKLSGLKYLKIINLCDNSIVTLPEEITRLVRIVKIDLSQNLDLNLDDAFRKLSRIRTLADLDLSNNVFVEIPPSLGYLRGLRRLELSYNWLHSIPPEVFRMPWLRELYLRGNSVKAVPDAIANLKQLYTLDLGVNELTSVSDSLYSLPRLQAIMLDGNNQLDYGYVCSRLSRMDIRHINLSSNWLQAVPNGVLEMENLEVLIFRNNYLTALPQGIFSLGRLKRLDISGNRIKNVNKEALGRKFLRKLINAPNGEDITPPELIF